MTVVCPPVEWPVGLLEAGPVEDRSILLHGQLLIGSSRFMLTAVRVDPVRFGPDFRADQDMSVYSDYELPALLDIVSELMGMTEPSTLELASGQYVMWILPAGDE